MRNRLIDQTALVFALAILVGGCSSSGTASPSGNGGSPGSGGANGGTGGSSTGTGGAGGGGSAKVTTVAGSKAFKDLTDAELTQVCNDTFAYFGSSITIATRCKWAGLQASSSSSPTSDAMMQMTCTTHQSLCTSADGGAGNNPTCFGSIDPACTATVAQYAACITDETAGFSDTVKALPGLQRGEGVRRAVHHEYRGWDATRQLRDVHQRVQRPGRTESADALAGTAAPVHHRLRCRPSA